MSNIKEQIAEISVLEERFKELQLKQALWMKLSFRIDELIAEVTKEDGRVSNYAKSYIFTIIDKKYILFHNS